MITFKKIDTGQEDGCTTGSVLYYSYFKEYYKLIGRDLSKQTALDVDTKTIQQNNFTGNLAWDAIHVFHYWGSKIWRCFTYLFCFDIILIWNYST